MRNFSANTEPEVVPSSTGGLTLSRIFVWSKTRACKIPAAAVLPCRRVSLAGALPGGGALKETAADTRVGEQAVFVSAFGSARCKRGREL